MSCNIVFISHSLLWQVNSAASARMMNYAKTLLVHDNYKIFFLSDRTSLSSVCPVGDNMFANVKSDACITKFTSSLKFYKELPDFVHSLKGSIVFIVYPSPYCITEFLFLKRYKKFKKMGYKAFCEINELRRYDVGFYALSFLKRNLLILLCCIMERKSAEYEGLICISSNIRDYYTKYNNQSIVIPILSDFKDPILHKKAIERISMNFVFMGTVSIDKENLYELLKGFSFFNRTNKNWALNLYGRVPDTDKIRINKIIHELGLSDKVKIHGEMPRSEIPDLLLTADCLLLPRRNNKQNFYGFPTKLSEYSAAGKPIILTDTGGVREFFRDGYNCLMPKGYEAKDFCEKLNQFLSMSAYEKSRLGENAVKTARKNFYWKNYSEKLSLFLSK